jgi:peroxiredoxin Q/BCP
MKLKPGIKAPEFNVNDQNGKPVSLKSLKGKKVVLYFYPKDMTPGCTAESCNLRDNYKILQKQGYEVFGVSSDNEKSHQKFIAKEKLPFSLLADTDKKVHEAYGTWVEKSMYGRKYMGTARTTFLIDEEGKIADIITQVDTKNHTDQILGIKKEQPKSAVVKKKPSSGTKKKTAHEPASKTKAKPVKNQQERNPENP